MPDFTLTRTFHPVGQGAFYSERFSFGDNDNQKKDFLTVYDCGTDLHNRKEGTPTELLNALKSRLSQDLGPKGSISKKYDVDLLFISHFDEDHVCGVPFLSPKVVVIPLMTPDEISFYALLNTLHITHVNLPMLTNPKQYFGDGTTVIGIEPEVEEGYVGDNPEGVDIDEEGYVGPLPEENGPIRDQGRSGVDRVLPSGASISIKSGIKLWQYIVFNPILPKLKASEIQNFKNVLSKAGWNWNTLADDLKKGLDEAKIDKLRDIYKATIRKNLNSTSLLVYSVPTDKLTGCDILSQKTGVTSNTFWCDPHRRRCSRYYECQYCEDYWWSPTCMYFGDWTITQKAIMNYYSYVWKHGYPIGTIQIPHHGSRYSNGQYALRFIGGPVYIRCVISCGERNRFRHPSALVQREIMKLGGRLILVTDNCSSAFIASFRLNY